MASNGERRMVFDTTGKRKQVVRVVYAILALLMGTSLFLVIGPFNLGELVGGSGTSSASKVFDEQAERLEAKLATNPNDAQLLLGLTRARISAGNSQVEVVSEAEAPVVSPEAREDFEAAARAWSLYLKQAGDEPSPAAAQLVGGTFFRLAESALSVREAAANVARAAAAQRIAAEQRPNVGSLSSLAIFEYYDGDYAAGDKATKQAVAKAPAKTEAKAIEEQMAEYRKRSKAFAKQKKEFAKLEREGEEALQNQGQSPFGGLGASPVAPPGE
jgi:hypothetical protein